MHDFSEVVRKLLIGLLLQMHDFSEVSRGRVVGLFLQMRDFSEVEMISGHHIFHKYLIINN